MDNLIKQAEQLKKSIKSKKKEIDNPVLVAAILNELDYFVENLGE